MKVTLSRVYLLVVVLQCKGKFADDWLSER